LFYIKGAVQRLINLLGWDKASFSASAQTKLDYCLQVAVEGTAIAHLGLVNKKR